MALPPALAAAGGAPGPAADPIAAERVFLRGCDITDFEFVRVAGTGSFGCVLIVRCTKAGVPDPAKHYGLHRGNCTTCRNIVKSRLKLLQLSLQVFFLPRHGCQVAFPQYEHDFKW